MKWYVLVILFATGASLAGLSMVVFRFDPFQASQQIKFLFSCSLFVSIWGLGTLVLMGFRSDFTGAFRRGLFLAIVVSGAIVLNRLHLLNIFNFSILLGIIATIEVFLTRTFTKKENELWT